MSEYVHHEMFPLGHDDTPYRLLSADAVKTTKVDGRTLLKVDPAVLTALAEAATTIPSTCSGPPIWHNCAASWTIPKHPPTIVSWRWNC
jgi:hypothetical protein